MGDLVDDDIDDDENDSNLVKDLRKQLRAAKKANDERDAELNQFRAQTRKSSVASLLSAAGADPEYAEFYTSDDSSEDAVKAWIQSKSKLLNIQPPDDTDPEVAAAAAAISGVAANAPQTKIGSLESKMAAIKAAKTPEDFAAAMEAAGLSTKS